MSSFISGGFKGAGLVPYDGSSGIFDMDAVFISDNRPTFNNLTGPLLMLSGPTTGTGWVYHSIDISSFAGKAVSLVFRYTNGGDGFTGDIQIDELNFNGTYHNFEGDGASFQTCGANNQSDYNAVAWESLITGATPGKFNMVNGIPISTGTGIAAYSGSYSVYAETSAPANVSGYGFWLRSPLTALNGSPDLDFYVAREGADIGTLTVHLDVLL